jgi:predicted lipid-binding transport protein (Tim44 family)
MSQQSHTAPSQSSDQQKLAMARVRIATQRQSFVPRFIGYVLAGMLIGGVLPQVFLYLITTLTR